jgi:hypothetical protein
LIESDSKTAKLSIKAKDHDKLAVWTIFQQLRRITNEDNRLWISTDNGFQFVQMQDIIEQIGLGNKDAKIKTMSGAILSIVPSSWLFDKRKPVQESTHVDQKRSIKLFVSYAHRDLDYFNVFQKEFYEQLNNSNRYKFTNFDDSQLILGEDWNERLEQKVKECDLGILLISAAFLNSNYIQEKELGTMLEKLSTESNFVLCPIYFKSFDFEEFEFLKKYQFFKPNGAKYEQADKGTNFSFAHLVKFNNSNGAIQNPLRDDYLLDLSKAVHKALDDKFKK